MAETLQERVIMGEVSFWDDKFKACQLQRQQYENQWFMNLAFYFGRQWAVWRKTTQGNRLVDPPAPRNRVRLITNKIMPSVRREIAKKTKEEPIFYVNPATTESTDIAAARAAEGIADFILRTTEFRKIRRSEAFWDSICGTGFYKTSCLGEDADVTIEAISPWHLFVPNLQEEEIENQDFVIHGRAVSQEMIKDTWGFDIQTDVTVSGATLEQKFFTALGINNQTLGASKLVYVKEIWVKPGRMSRYPNGAVLVIAGGKVIYRYQRDETVTGQTDPLTAMAQSILNPEIPPSDYPYDHGEYPFKKTILISAGRFYGMSVVEHAIPLQRELNKSRSQIVETKNRTSKPPLVYEQGTLDPRKVTSEPGQFLPVRQGSQKWPEYMRVPEVPAYAQNNIEEIKRDIDELFSRFDLPVGVHASTAISYLSEEADASLRDSIASQEDAIEGVGRQTLQLVNQFWTIEKITSVVSKNSAQDAQVFKMETKENFQMDLRVQAGSMAPKSIAAKQAFLLELADRGFPLEQLLQYLGMNETQRLFEDSQTDSKQAQRENITMSQQTQAIEYPTHPWDVDEVHIFEHGKFMKSNDFELLDPLIQQVFVNHYLQHQQKIQEKMNAGALGPQQSGPIPTPDTTNPSQPTPGT